MHSAQKPDTGKLGSFIGWRRVCVSLVAVGVLGLAASCGPPAAERDPGLEDDINAEEASERGSSAGQEREVSFRQLSNNSEELYGERVTVSATVARVIQPKAFTLVSDEPEGDEEPVEDAAVLVISGEDVASGLSEEQSVRVQGKVRAFDPRELERKLGVELQDSLRASYEDRPALLANSVRPIQR